MVETEWGESAGGLLVVFRVRCACGAEHAALATDEAVDRKRAERAAWARFIFAARQSGCRSCRDAADAYVATTLPRAG